MSYSEHGRFSLDCNGRVLCSRAVDQWSERTAVDYVREFVRLADALRGDAWAAITDLTDWELGVPEVEQRLCSLGLWSVEAGQTHSAIVMPRSAVVLWHVRQLMSENRRVSAVQYFDDAFSACGWLSAVGFRFNEERCRQFFTPVPAQGGSPEPSRRTAR